LPLAFTKSPLSSISQPLPVELAATKSRLPARTVEILRPTLLMEIKHDAIIATLETKNCCG
jgi:hypothetical protein